MRHLPKFCLHFFFYNNRGVTEVLQFNETFTEVLPSFFFNNRGVTEVLQFNVMRHLPKFCLHFLTIGVTEVLQFNETFTEVLPSFFNSRGVTEVLCFNETFTEVLPSFFNNIRVTKFSSLMRHLLKFCLQTEQEKSSIQCNY